MFTKRKTTWFAMMTGFAITQYWVQGTIDTPQFGISLIASGGALWLHWFACWLDEKDKRAKDTSNNP